MKIQKISDITATLPLTEFDFLKKYQVSFASSELGRIHALLPLAEIASDIASRMPARKPQGNKHMFPPEGEVGLMFLKSYTGLSDDRLIEMLNGNIHMQIFCGVLLDPENPIRNGRIVSAIRNRIAGVLDIRALQKLLYQRWEPHMENKDRFMTDATCYESHLRFPTDVKLLWECCDWLHTLMAKTCGMLGERQPRNKFADVAAARLDYAKKKKPKASLTRMIKRRLIKLLGKMIVQWEELIKDKGVTLVGEQKKRLDAAKKVLEQQKVLFEGGKVEERIVSIDRPYIRPIIRGKENSRVEFGAKVNNIQIDGISFIEHHSFDAFHEGIRLGQCIAYHHELTGLEAREIGADAIYATNDNRTLCSKEDITTNFARKGPKPKDEDPAKSAARRILGNLRATVMEGSFGNQKEHFGVGRIAARNRESETLLLFFGIHMANAATLAARIQAKEEKERNKKNPRRA